jgi:hypothetical protein
VVKGARRLRLATHRHRYADCLQNVESSMSHNFTGFHGLLQGYLYVLTFCQASDMSQPCEPLHVYSQKRLSENVHASRPQTAWAQRAIMSSLYNVDRMINE